MNIGLFTLGMIIVDCFVLLHNDLLNNSKCRLYHYTYVAFMLSASSFLAIKQDSHVFFVTYFLQNRRSTILDYKVLSYFLFFVLLILFICLLTCCCVRLEGLISYLFFFFPCVLSIRSLTSWHYLFVLGAALSQSSLQYNRQLAFLMVILFRGMLAFKSTCVTCWHVNIPIPEMDILLESLQGTLHH